MPVKRRAMKRRWASGTPPLGVHLNLTCGFDYHAGPPAFADDDERREAWDAYRTWFLERSRRGSRPEAWWRYESPAPRDHATDEAAQLWRMGQLQGDELAAVMRRWKDAAETARNLPPGPAGAAATEAEFRRWAGVPDELFDDRL